MNSAQCTKLTSIIVKLKIAAGKIHTNNTNRRGFNPRAFSFDTSAKVTTPATPLHGSAPMRVIFLTSPTFKWR
jgi:hypothetical protein